MNNLQLSTSGLIIVYNSEKGGDLVDTTGALTYCCNWAFPLLLDLENSYSYCDDHSDCEKVVVLW